MADERRLSVSGEDQITVDRKYLPSVIGKLPTRFIVITNELPRLSDASGALTGRLILLRFTRSFYGREDPRLTDRLLAEWPRPWRYFRILNRAETEPLNRTLGEALYRGRPGGPRWSASSAGIRR